MTGIDHLLDSNVVIGLLKLPDVIIAATALVTGTSLLTLDQRLLKVVHP